MTVLSFNDAKRVVEKQPNTLLEMLDKYSWFYKTITKEPMPDGKTTLVVFGGVFVGDYGLSSTPLDANMEMEISAALDEIENSEQSDFFLNIHDNMVVGYSVIGYHCETILGDNVFGFKVPKGLEDDVVFIDSLFMNIPTTLMHFQTSVIIDTRGADALINLNKERHYVKRK